MPGWFSCPPAEKALGSPKQNDREQQHHRQVARGGEAHVDRRVVIDELLEQAYNHGREHRAAERTQPADDDDDEGEDQSRRSALGIDVAEVKGAQGTGERGGHAAQRKDEGERALDVDAKRGHHRPILDPRANDESPAGEPQERREKQEDGGGRGNREQPAVRDVRARKLRHTLGPARGWIRNRVRAEDSLDEGGEREGKADRDQDLLDVSPV